MMKKLFMFFVFVVWTACMSGCSNSKEQEATDLSALVDIQYEIGPEISKQEILTVWLVNQSSSCISFPLDYGIKVFAETGEGWTEVPNVIEYKGTGPNLLKPKGDIFSQRSIVVKPDLSSLTLAAPTRFYVEIQGHECADDSHIVKKEIPFTVVP